MDKVPSKASVIRRVIKRSVAPSMNCLTLLSALGVCGWELSLFSVFMLFRMPMQYKLCVILDSVLLTEMRANRLGNCET